MTKRLSHKVVAARFQRADVLDFPLPGTLEACRHDPYETVSKTMHGIVHGRSIELDEDLGVADGQEVEVQVRVIPKTSRKLGEGFPSQQQT